MSVNVLPLSGLPVPQFLSLIATTINELLRGRANNAGSLTLAASVTTTQVIDTRVKLTTRVFLSPRSANACAALTGLYVSDVADGSFTLTHASTATTDRTFDYVLHA